MEYKPLYAHIRDELVRHLVDGSWAPGMLIPSEMELARRMKVSQGTVRKALDTMTADNLLVRKQGKGTFVAEPEDSRILFQFFRLVPDDGPSVFPQSTVIDSETGAASAEEASALELTAGDPVRRILRIRRLAERCVLSETLCLPAGRFCDFPAHDQIPNNIYQLFSTRWGITIAQAEERLKAIPAGEEDARLLSCPVGTPLLRIHRIARDLEGKAVELRVSHCLTESIHYAVNLR
ncbi:GntR family transcriptional regulator [Nitratireductor sp. ZSWI3]|uniref:GntR family transcriptional regulator n=1 Tax=Nitratireductor sp. ZSWI3 TaxID=2966359 RepID=UPI00214F8A25|nr:GntR family transcriptional regulator [Nitratireductor sp. ZSWI3]MCR4265457.1 GntR family transcriptional regulator [Nitratireductor sp. ZSWI3]